MTSIVGLDIGGANLKAAHSSGAARLRPFELWRDPAGLATALHELLALLPPFESLAVTMTGELCDCFESKRQGVAAILDAAEAVAGPRPILVWQTDGRLVEPAVARSAPMLAASANWHALATYAGRFAPSGPALLIDVGSTTTDIVPLMDGKPVPRGRTDFERLRSGELIYTGIRRTPLCALLGADGMAELFATTLDVYLVLGKQVEDPGDCRTADGRPATRLAAHARLARMIGADLETSTESQRRELALRVCNRQMLLIRQGIEKSARHLPGPPTTVILAGSGEFLARAAIELPPDAPNRLSAIESVFSLEEQLGSPVSHAACAHAMAVLASELAIRSPPAHPAN